jgi:hypothetical protein
MTNSRQRSRSLGRMRTRATADGASVSESENYDQESTQHHVASFPADHFAQRDRDGTLHVFKQFKEGEVHPPPEQHDQSHERPYGMTMGPYSEFVEDEGEAGSGPPPGGPPHGDPKSTWPMWRNNAKGLMSQMSGATTDRIRSLADLNKRNRARRWPT